MFVNQEILDHFPGEFTNFYLIRLTIDIPEISAKVDDEIEVVGIDTQSFKYVKNNANCLINKSDAVIIRKMIKPIKNKS